MMTVRTRIATTVLRWLIIERKRPLVDVGRMSLRCWPFDCDLNMHMNNSRYLGLMDLGRWHFVLVAGIAGEMRARGLMPVAVHVDIDFKKSIGPFQRFTLETKLEAVGTKSFTVSQQFWLGDELAASANVVCLLRNKQGTQLVAPLFDVLPHLRLPELSTT
ncbi:MAG: hypothetical protein JWM80_4061 [Cyanobacteria bacterium RYN_339]|nr:hypothetical protein [Cyanobacteria bacterium RYN_339]